ncbi:aldo-keto reductase family 1 member A1-B isoform X2 [Engraulis encrasicolus]|uniref:aldo-keto reductase family 1 member A1-B isoform X2 n=1 Tax=Engraulis encrasicolus TaxID=184585 RepID=UPI002FCFE716
MKKGSEEPSQHGPEPKQSDGPNTPLHPSIQEFIFNLNEEEWKDFISMIDCQMARNQFVEVCQAVLQVVSSSSMNVILPVFAHKERDLEHSSNTCPSCKSAGSSTSAKMSGRPASQGRMLRLKVSLAALWKTMTAWRPSCATSIATTALCSSVTDHRSDSGEQRTSDLPEVDSVVPHGGECCDPASIEEMVDRVLSSEGLDSIARDLVDGMQGILQQSSPSVTPSASGRSTPLSQPPQMVYSYAGAAVEDLLKPLLPFLVAHSAPLDGPRRADSPAPDAVDELPAENKETASSHSKDQSTRTASCEPDMEQQDSESQKRLLSMISFFTNLMAHQLMVTLQKEAAVKEWSNDQKGMFEGLIDKVLSESSGASGAPNSHEHLNNNIKIQTIYSIMEKLLLKESGSEDIQQKAVKLEDGSFHNSFLTKLRELLHKNNKEVTDAPPTSLRASSSLGSVPVATGAQKGGRFSRFRLKVSRRRSTKVSPVSAISDMDKHAETAAPCASTEMTSDASVDGPNTCKRSWIMRVFGCCLQSPTEA